MKTDRDFKGIWIPKEIWENQNLTLQEKVFYVEIDSLNNENGCFASNDYFARFFGLSKKRVSIVIQALIKKNLIKATISEAEGNLRIMVTLSPKTGIPSPTKQGDPIPENGEHNNTVNDKKNNTVKAATPEELKKLFFENPIFEALKKSFPNRDYELEFNLMVDWWKQKKGKLPQQISAFKNWLAYSRPANSPKIIKIN